MHGILLALRNQEMISCVGMLRLRIGKREGIFSGAYADVIDICGPS